MSVNSTNTLRFTITAVDNLTRAAMTEKYGAEGSEDVLGKYIYQKTDL